MNKKQKRTKDLYLQRTYHITLTRYDELRKFQGYACAVCRKSEKIFKNGLAVDHNHKTGEVRGLLCWSCNRALGRWRDDDMLVNNASHYVMHPPMEVLVGHKVYTATGTVGTKVRAKLLKKFNAPVT